MQHIFQTPVSLAISVPRNTAHVTKHTLQTLFSFPSTLDGRLQGCSSSPTDCPAAADMLRFLPQESPGPAPRKPLLRARFLPHASRQRFAGECLSAENPKPRRVHSGKTGVASTKETRTPMAGKQAASKTEKEPVEIKLAHSPDSDDAFMFYALATHKLATPGYKYTHILSDIQSLNEAALTETYDVTAISFAAYPALRDKYILLECGASFGEGYGPIVVSTKSLKPQELAGRRIGVPGLKTSAYLTLKLYEPNFEAVVMPFDKIIDAVQNNLVEAGLLIHEGQLFFPQMGLHRVIDLGIWWQEQTCLPLPLGGNAVRRALGPNLGRQIAKTIRDSVSYGLEHREEALNYAMQFARNMDTELADKFIGMYVNQWTLGYGEKGQQAVKELIARGTKAGLLPGPPTVEFLREA
jgi:1,4-dihydroxy-6-naphthoate synthase